LPKKHIDVARLIIECRTGESPQKNLFAGAIVVWSDWASPLRGRKCGDEGEEPHHQQSLRQSRWFSWAGGFAVFDDLLRRRFGDHTNGRYKFDGGAMRGSHNSAFDPQTLVLLVTIRRACRIAG
jgi:hypothetical protein